MADDPKKAGGGSDSRLSSSQGETMDIFVAQSIYPEAEAVFTAKLGVLADAKANACIVLDTNALLVPYGIGAQTLAEVEATYKRLLGEKRLLIPAQVAREFARNRVTRLAELHQKLSRRRNQPQNFQQGSYPLLENLQQYQELRKVEDQLDALLSEYRKLLTSVIDHVQAWEWNDPVSTLYSKLFGKDVIVDTTMPLEEIRQEHRRRFANKIPPGYKDEAKDDQGIGDLLIWLTILAAAAQKKTSVIFVSGEEKADWWYRSENQQLYPRYELVDEFRRASGGHSFHIIKFSRLLELFGASKKVVAEVRQEERVAIPETPALGRHSQIRLQHINAEQAVSAWLIDSGYKLSPVGMREDHDFVVEGAGGTFGVEIIYSDRVIEFARRIRERAYRWRQKPEGRDMALVVVSEKPEVLEVAERAWRALDPPFRLCTGLLMPDGSFRAIRPF